MGLPGLIGKTRGEKGLAPVKREYSGLTVSEVSDKGLVLVTRLICGDNHWRVGVAPQGLRGQRGRLCTGGWCPQLRFVARDAG